MSLEIATLLLAAFRGREDHVAVGNADNTFAPQKLDRPLPPAWLAERHLAGTRCLGFYLMDPESRVWCSCVDFDNKPQSPDPAWQIKAEKVYEWLSKAGLSPLVEISASGCAAHVWLFFEEATPAWIARAFWRLVSEKAAIPFKEVYPRQDGLSGKGMGNLVRYPLWNQSRFVDVENEWAKVESLDALAAVRRTSGPELKEIAFRLGAELKAELRPGLNGTNGSHQPGAPGEPSDLPARVRDRLGKHPHSLLARRWGGDTSGLKDDSRSSLAQSIACELVRQYVPTAEIAAALRHWCREQEYEKGARPDWIERTVGKAYEFTHQRSEERSAATTQMKDASHAYVATLRRGERVCHHSGIGPLDASIDGVAPGEMCVIAARPGHGKTAIALQWLDHAAKNGSPCLLISEEMSVLELGKRGLLSLSSLPQEHWGRATADALDQDIEDYYGEHAPLHVVESCNHVERAVDVIDQHAAQHGIALVAVDYVQLLGARGEKRYDEVTNISRQLKQAAKRNHVGLLAVCQLNREIDKRPGHEPHLSDLRESGQLEQDADLVLFVQWPWKYDDKLDQREYLIWAAKRRNGPIRAPKVITTFRAERQRIGGWEGEIVDPFDGSPS